LEEIMTRHLIKILLAAFALLVHLPGSAEDIDLFVGIEPSKTDLPNVLIMVDNTANWNQPFSAEMGALVNIFNGLSLTPSKFRVGVMMFSETGNGNSNTDGSYVRAAIREMDAATATKYAAMISKLDVGNDKSNGGKIAKAMEEAYLYFKGGTPYGGNDKNKTDYTGNTFGNAESKAIYALPANALATRLGTTYTSPIGAGSCAHNYIIYISNGAAQDNASDIAQAAAALDAAAAAQSQPGSSPTIPLNPSGSQDNVADEWARFLKVSTLGISVYTIDVNKLPTGQGPGWTALLQSTAGQSGGKYYDVSSAGIEDALNDALSEIQSVNSVFASVSLPVSVNTQGTYLNQVYVGMFRPDQKLLPRWAGNLKQYKLGVLNGALKLEDADSNSAINNSTGFISECARSFWTPTTAVGDTEWATAPSGDCLKVANSRAANYPDGNIVEKGAEAYVLRHTANPPGRTLYTCSATSAASCSSGGLTAFSTSNVTAAMLGPTVGATEQAAIINWAIGADNLDENGNLNYTEPRLSIHGDVVHSRPVAINFAAAGATPSVVTFYGGNDGLLRAVNGNRTNAIGSYPAGAELWSFMPPEFYPNIKRLRDNTITISYPNNNLDTPPPQPKNYGMDGPITAFNGTVGGANKQFVFATMRRGGRAV
jgi:type IV pilus assembly protein PilY1